MISSRKLTNFPKKYCLATSSIAISRPLSDSSICTTSTKHVPTHRSTNLSTAYLEGDTSFFYWFPILETFWVKSKERLLSTLMRIKYWHLSQEQISNLISKKISRTPSFLWRRWSIWGTNRKTLKKCAQYFCSKTKKCSMKTKSFGHIWSRRST